MTETTLTQSDDWDVPRESERRLDPLLECLMALARIHGVARTRDAFTAGLPLVDQVLTPSIFDRAARRAGMVSKIMHKDLAALSEALLPVVLLLQDRTACVLVGWEQGGEVARVIMPELGEAAVEIDRAALEARYIGRLILCRPEFHFDKRSPTVGDLRGRHWFWGAIIENLPVYKDILVAAALINLFGLAMPLFIRVVYDRVVPNNAIETAWMLAIGVMVIIGADILLRTLRGYLIDLAGSRVDVKLSSQIMERVLGVRMENRPISAGAFAANLQSFETIRNFITSATLTALVDLPFAILFIVVVAIIDWPMAMPALVGSLLMIVVSLLVQARIHALSETTYRAGAQRNANLVESLVGLETLKTLGAEGVMQRKWEQSATFLARNTTQLRFLASATTNSAHWITQMVFLSVVIIGVYRIGDGFLSMGGLIACIMLSRRAMAPFSQVAHLLTNYHNAATALTNLNKVMGTAVERPMDATFISRNNFEGDIEFIDVSFCYPGEEKDALRHASFHIKPGEHVAIIGRVGSGKSTLQKLILSLYQATSGSIRIDGVDIRQLDPAELRRNIGYVPQDVTLFYGTLRDNIIMATPNVDDAALLTAADVGGLMDVVNNHPRGFDMIVGERGESLSGGQRQGVAIARAVVNTPQILLFDEPTGSMDFSSEEEVRRKLREFAKGKTLLMVTHRTSLLDLVDRIIVVDYGKVVADGPKATVVEALKHGRIERAK